MNFYNLSKTVAATACLIAPFSNAEDASHHHHHHSHQQGASHAQLSAPIGVMGDHVHPKGSWMMSYRHMSMRMEGHRAGEERLSSHEVFHRGFDVAATEMNMDMHMIGLMFAPSERVTVMGMANYLENDMTMMSNPNAMGGHGHMQMGHGHSGTFSHSSEGWGDLHLSSLVRVGNLETSPWHLNLGLSVPTGSVSEREDGVFLPYGMQLGSGTWDARLGATYSGARGSSSYGFQAMGTLRLESVGDSGFGRSDRMESTGWYNLRVTEGFSLSGRLKYSAEGPFKGHYNGPHMHRAPNHFPENYGGDILEGLIGVSFSFQSGFLKGHRIAAEYGMPIYQQLNGVGMSRDSTLSVGWRKEW